MHYVGVMVGNPSASTSITVPKAKSQLPIKLNILVHVHINEGSEYCLDRPHDRYGI